MLRQMFHIVLSPQEISLWHLSHIILQVLQMESLVLSYLDYEMSATTANCFLRFVFAFLNCNFQLWKNCGLTTVWFLKLLRWFVWAAHGFNEVFPPWTALLLVVELCHLQTMYNQCRFLLSLFSVIYQGKVYKTAVHLAVEPYKVCGKFYCASGFICMVE